MVTVHNYDRNGNPIDDLTQITIDLTQYPAIMALLEEKEPA